MGDLVPGRLSRSVARVRLLVGKVGLDGLVWVAESKDRRFGDSKACRGRCEGLSGEEKKGLT